MILSEQELTVLTLSLEVAILSTAWALPPALGTAWLLARTRVPGKTLISGIAHLPMVLPPVVIGYLLLILLGRNGLLGGWLFDTFNIRFVFTTKAAVIAATVMAFPLMVRALRLSLEAVDRDLEEAAAVLGAGPVQRLVTIVLPLMAPGLLTACVLGFARALGEFGATITFAASVPGETRTLPLALYALLQTPGGEAAAARLMLISVAVALLAVGLSEVLARRGKRLSQSADPTHA